MNNISENNKKNNNKNNNKGHSFAKGAFIITLGMLAVKFFGAVFENSKNKIFQKFDLF